MEDGGAQRGAGLEEVEGGSPTGGGAAAAPAGGSQRSGGAVDAAPWLQENGFGSGGAHLSVAPEAVSEDGGDQAYGAPGKDGKMGERRSGLPKPTAIPKPIPATAAAAATTTTGTKTGTPARPTSITSPPQGAASARGGGGGGASSSQPSSAASSAAGGGGGGGGGGGKSSSSSSSKPSRPRKKSGTTTPTTPGTPGSLNHWSGILTPLSRPHSTPTPVRDKVAIIRSAPRAARPREVTTPPAQLDLSHVFSEKQDYSHVNSKCNSMANLRHSPGGGNVQITTKKIDLSNVSSKCGSFNNVRHKPGGGNVQIQSHKLEFKDKAKSKVGSLDNTTHTPGGGNIKIESHKLNFRESARSRTDHGADIVSAGHTPRRLSNVSSAGSANLLESPRLSTLASDVSAALAQQAL
ncbi:uncharacterized protein LOC116954723 isoform X4 [Petromyzon marinus]|uniref:Microtubule-associated protein n=1 Tax=Petromyzon marinus TaxID=7757 RepID=A0AAJ7U9X0_PETMA|nr:microtubule-associated protein tau-like isoform X4 [Petromyzon marinus]